LLVGPSEKPIWDRLPELFRFRSTLTPHPERLAGNELNRFKHLPHPEERHEAARLEGWATSKVRVPILRDAVLRPAPQDEVIGLFIASCFSCIHFRPASEERRVSKDRQQARCSCPCFETAASQPPQHEVGGGDSIGLGKTPEPPNGGKSFLHSAALRAERRFIWAKANALRCEAWSHGLCGRARSCHCCTAPARNEVRALLSRDLRRGRGEVAFHLAAELHGGQ